MAIRVGNRRRAPLRAAPDPAGATEDVVDLRDDSADEATLVDAAELQALFRARAARAEAERELMRLRARHWSGERLIEEGCIEAEWWEHPDADPYAVLGLLPGSRIEAAAAARRQVALRCHPDKADLHGAEQELALRRLVAANAAYDRLRRALHPV
jgi:DnaJ-domain-containing protein 1